MTDAASATSARARLLNRARQTGEQHELTLVRFASERFLYRLGCSEYRDRFVLKGAALLTLWLDDPYRATRDLDFLARGATGEADLHEAVAGICAVSCPEDGLSFDLGSLEVSPIRIDQEFQGQRVVLRAYLGSARIRMQMDFGAGDSLHPAAELTDYPTLLPGLPAPRVRTYPREASLAEKFDAMVQHGRKNSRMKDFHDVWALSSTFAFEGPLLRQAVVTSLDGRSTEWIQEAPAVLGSAFSSDPGMQARWGDYLRAGAFQAAPPADFESLCERVRQFFGPLRDSVVAERAFDQHWPPGGPWR